MFSTSTMGRPSARAQHQAQVQAQVRGVDDADQQLGHRLARHCARPRRGSRPRPDFAHEAVAPGRSSTRIAPAWRCKQALLALHGHARVVGHLLRAPVSRLNSAVLPQLGCQRAIWQPLPPQPGSAPAAAPLGNCPAPARPHGGAAQTWYVRRARPVDQPLESPGDDAHRLAGQATRSHQAQRHGWRAPSRPGAGRPTTAGTPRGELSSPWVCWVAGYRPELHVLWVLQIKWFSF